ncbi:MAG: class I SAM-dependent methyltransferase, partial [Nitrospira sp.]|nr:class I SAM-dependent methyltransferase [Nitrospira sp.]
MKKDPANLHQPTVDGFGFEWSHFDQSALPVEDKSELFAAYFDIFPWERLPQAAEGFDAGCGSGRWAMLVAPRVGTLHCVDASSDALEVARRGLAANSNCLFHHASIDSLPFPDETQDFGYSLGVLHHVPDTEGGLSACVSKLKPGAPFLLYLYYALDNRQIWYRLLWRASDVFRRGISMLPAGLKLLTSQIIALLLYWPLARFALLVERLGANASPLPLYFYRHRSFYVMQTDALDRFGTQLEKRFTRIAIKEMMGR